MPYNMKYGTFDTRTFKQLFPSVEGFLAEWNATPFAQISNGVSLTDTLKEDSLTKTYFLLMARYANSNIASSSEEQFKYKVFSTMFEYGPTWEKRLQLQTSIRNLSLEQLQQGNKTIMNQAQNPGTTPTTTQLEELAYINSQNTANSKRGAIDAYAYQWDMLKTDVTEDYVSKFKKHFITIAAANYPLYYITEQENN